MVLLDVADVDMSAKIMMNIGTSEGAVRATKDGHDGAVVRCGTRSVFQVEDEKYKGTKSTSKHPENDSSRQARRASAASATVPVSIPYTTAASEFLYGSSVVAVALKARRRKLYNLYLHPRAEQNWEDATIRSLARIAGVHVKDVGNDWLPVMDKMSASRPHNGCILEASPLPKLPVTGFRTTTQKGGYFNIELGRQQREDQLINGTNDRIPFRSDGWRHPFVLFADGILDEGNLGAILRSAYYLGVDAVALPVYKCAPLSPIALKAAAGAAEALQILSVDRPASFLDSSVTHGWRVYGAVAPQADSASTSTSAFSASKSSNTSRAASGSSPGSSALTPSPSSSLITYSTASLPTRPLPAHSPLSQHPSILMLGGEGVGLRQGLLSRAQYLVGINPGRDVEAIGVDSLNVSVAAALLCAEFLRRPGDGGGEGGGRKTRERRKEKEGLLF